MIFIKALLFFFVLGSASIASASPEAVHAIDPAVSAKQTLRVAVVRNAFPGCEPNCEEWISAEGKIEPGSLGQFRRVLNSIGSRQLPIFINSAGGSVNTAIEIGKFIRAKGLEIAPSPEQNSRRNRRGRRPQREAPRKRDRSGDWRSGGRFALPPAP